MKAATEVKAGVIPEQVMQSLAIHLGKLEAALLAKDPEMPNHLRESHRLLITYPETVHLLDDTEVAALISAAEEYTKVRIVAEAAKGKGSRSKKEVNAELDL
jgi:hypothetical protein